MSLQTWWSAASAVPFPTIVRAGGLQSSCLQLRKLFWHAPAQKLVAVFTNTTLNFGLGGGFLLGWRVQYLWRDGQPVDMPTIVNEVRENDLPITHTTDGRVVRLGTVGETVADAEMNNATGDGMFSIATQWAHDILAYPSLGSASVVRPFIQASVLRPADGVGWRVSNMNGRLIVVQQPDNITVLSLFNGSLFGTVRDFLWIDNATAAITTVSITNTPGVPAILHLLSVHTTSWTLLWSASLPGTDAVAAWDEANQVLYSCGRYESNAVMHASWLRRAPASISTITVRGSATSGGLVQLQSSLLSVRVTDSMGSGVCNTTVTWSLDPATSGGMLVSQYSFTNNSGIATVAYLGPLLSGNAITETVCAAVATIDAVTQI